MPTVTVGIPIVIRTIESGLEIACANYYRDSHSNGRFGERPGDYTLETRLKPLMNHFRSALDMCLSPIPSRGDFIFGAIA